MYTYSGCSQRATLAPQEITFDLQHKTKSFIRFLARTVMNVAWANSTRARVCQFESVSRFVLIKSTRVCSRARARQPRILLCDAVYEYTLFLAGKCYVLTFSPRSRKQLTLVFVQFNVVAAVLRHCRCRCCVCVCLCAVRDLRVAESIEYMCFGHACVYVCAVVCSVCVCVCICVGVCVD